MKRIFLLFIFYWSTFYTIKAQNVGINSSGATPNASAGLDVNFTNKGVLIPRVSLSATNSNAPIGVGIATSLLVYNTATAGTSPNNVTPGYYYWDGAKWVSILNSANNPVSVSLNASCTVNTASPAFANVAGMSVTFVATKSTALVQFSVSGYAYTNSMAWVGFRIYNTTTSTSLGGTNTHMQSYDNVTGTLTPWSCSFSKNITGLTPGTSYTLIVQGQRGGIWGTLNAVIDPVTNPDNHHMTLTVFP